MVQFHDGTPQVRESGGTERFRLPSAPGSEIFCQKRRAPAARVGVAAGKAYGAAFDPGHAFEFGLQRVLDGIEAFVRARSAQPGRQ
jgi:hypothetical protein